MKSKVPYCPYCDSVLDTVDVNISEGVALCRACDSVVPLSDLNFTGQTAEEALSNSYTDIKIDQGHQKISARFSLFSLGGFLGSLLFSVFWNGIVSVFVSIALAGLYYNLKGPIPDWFTAFGIEDKAPIMNGEVMGLGVTLGLCLFLVPFVLVGTLMAVNTLMRIAGTSEIVLERDSSYVATGIGGLKLKRSFDASSVTSIEYRKSRWNNNEEASPDIEISAERSIKFGSYLTDRQKEWARFFLKAMLIQKRNVGKVRKLSWL